MKDQQQAYFNLMAFNSSYFWNPCYYSPQLYSLSVNNLFQQEIFYEQNRKTLSDNFIKIQNFQIPSTQDNRDRKNLENKRLIEKKQKSPFYGYKQQKNKSEIKHKQLDDYEIQCSIEEIALNQKNQNQIFKTNWSSQQQQKLKQLVNLFGKRWKYISQYFPNRTGKQIRERYLNYLRPNLSLKKWSQQEDNLLLILIEKYGRSWRMIEKKIKHRSQNQIKNRYYGHLQKIQKNTNKQNFNQICQNNEEKQRQEMKTQTHIDGQKESLQSVKL